MPSVGTKQRLFANPHRPGNEWGGRGTTFTATAYGPPWGGIEGTGVTSQGTKLNPNIVTGRFNGPFIIAVDPDVIPYGSQVYVWPNPFDYRGTFLADDTGGAIRGNRIDICDPYGRTHQNLWGVKSVQVTPAASGPPANARKVWAGFDANQDLGPGGPINFGGYDTGRPLPDPVQGILDILKSLFDIKTIIGIILVIIGLARVSGAI